MLQSLTNSQKSSDRLRDLWTQDLRTKELIGVLYLNEKRQQKFFKIICAGNRTNCGFDILEVIYHAYTTSSFSLIIAHNHPSGIAQPSEIDIELTKSIDYTLKSINIDLVDHIILTVDDYYSFADHGFFNKQESA